MMKKKKLIMIQKSKVFRNLYYFVLT